MSIRWLLVITALLVPLWSAPAQAGPRWDPKQTHALLVGALEWQSKDLESFPKANRKDRVLEKTLMASGVPAGQIVFLEDRQATGAAMRAALKALAAKAGPGSTLLVYYAGHGLRDETGMYFANYDINPDKPARTGFGIKELAPLLKDWRGDRLILTSDCCHSGALMGPVQQFGKRGVKAACITSATASNESTGNWTFTDALISAFGGDGRVDFDRNGIVAFQELDRFVAEQMKYGEDQLTHGVYAGGFEPQLEVASTRHALPPLAFGATLAPGSYIECRSDGKAWERAQILDFAKGSYKVQYLGEHPRQGWVYARNVRPVAAGQWQTGARVQVEWEGKWYLGRIQKAEANYFYFVRYDDYDPEWDEWVTAKRLRKP